MAVQPRSLKGRMLRMMKRGFGPVHIAAYRLSKGRVGGSMAGGRVLLLTTTGRKTGKRRTVPLIHWQRGDEFVISASNAGHWLPAWYGNLKANPHAVVEVAGRRIEATAHLADADESRELWKITEALNPKQFGGYREGLPYEIPMVVLQPRQP